MGKSIQMGSSLLRTEMKTGIRKKKWATSIECGKLFRVINPHIKLDCSDDCTIHENTTKHCAFWMNYVS